MPSVSRVTPPRSPTPRTGRRARPRPRRCPRARPGRRRRGGRRARSRSRRAGARRAPRTPRGAPRLTAFRSIAPPTLRLTETPRRTSSSGSPRSARPVIRLAREGVEDEEAVRVRAAVAVDAVEVAAARQAATLAPVACAARHQGVRRLRPLRRRRLITSRPARVRMRARKPCVFARLRFFGCQVRFMIGEVGAGGPAKPPRATASIERTRRRLFAAICDLAAKPGASGRRYGRAVVVMEPDRRRRCRDLGAGPVGASGLAARRHLRPLARAAARQSPPSAETLYVAAPAAGPDLGRAPLPRPARGRAAAPGERAPSGSSWSTPEQAEPGVANPAPGRRAAADRPHAHLRPLRDRPRQPLRPRRRPRRRRAARRGLQPALPPRRAGARQDPSAGRDRRLLPRPPPRRSPSTTRPPSGSPASSSPPCAPTGPSASRSATAALDALLIDDVQFLEGKPRTEEEFFHTFNALFASRQADRPLERPAAERPLAARPAPARPLRMGARASSSSPRPAHPDRAPVAPRRATRSSSSPTPDVLREIATRVPGNVRRLEGALTRRPRRLLDLRRAARRPARARGPARSGPSPDRDPARLRHHARSRRSRRRSASVLSVPREDILSKRRTPRVTRARQLAMFLSRELTPLSARADRPRVRPRPLDRPPRAQGRRAAKRARLRRSPAISTTSVQPLGDPEPPAGRRRRSIHPEPGHPQTDPHPVPASPLRSR